MKRALLIAFHFPPLAAGSGYLRAWKFAQHLPEYGWEPLVLTAHTRAYGDMDSVPQVEVPLDGIRVFRAFALDARLHLSIARRYPLALALPDRWSSWFVGAFFKGLDIIRRHRPEVIFSTYPIATAHLVALTLSRWARIPWIADFRDPMIKDDFPDDRGTLFAHRWIELKTVDGASRSLFTKELALSECRARYPAVPESRFSLLPNGYDEAAFEAAEAVAVPRSSGKLRVILHSGYLYTDFRDPEPLFRALHALKSEGELSARNIQIVFRGSDDEEAYEKLATEHGVDDLVAVLPGCTHSEAVRELLEADGLLLIQGAGVNAQIPAKLYEYMRARRPILGLVDPGGETARALGSLGITTVAPPDREGAIKTALMDFVRTLDAEPGPPLAPEVVSSCSREARTKQLAAIMNEVT